MTASAQGPKLQMDQLDFLANKASETVDVKLDERLMQTTAKFFSGKDPDDAEIKEVLKGIKGDLRQELHVRKGRRVFAGRLSDVAASRQHLEQDPNG